MKWNTADIGLNQNTVFQKIVGGLMHPTGYMMQEFFLYWYIILSGEPIIRHITVQQIQLQRKRSGQVR